MTRFLDENGELTKDGKKELRVILADMRKLGVRLDKLFGTKSDQSLHIKNEIEELTALYL